MIKVLNKKVEENKIYKATCDDCGAELECTKEDAHVGVFGSYCITCPVCGAEVIVDGIEPVDLNSGNIEFPLHFSKPSDSAVRIPDEEVQEFVRECLDQLSDQEAGSFHMMGTGDTMVFAFKYDDEYEIYVTRQYYDTFIPR